ncbi:MAG: hypothetical protein EBY18_15550 [Alphaproteobacteria bacterium]|nr:hypothetical protein [Alphaproteobacteria bacterium]
MFTMVKTMGLSVLARQELVPGVASFLIAEFFFKFKSFALECLAFLVTWVVLGYLWSLIVGKPAE